MITYLDHRHPFGGTNGDTRYPFPGSRPSQSWVNFKETTMNFLMFDRYIVYIQF